MDALVRFCLSNDPFDQEECRRELRKLLGGKSVPGTVQEESEALLAEIGIPTNMKGYQYILDAICIVVVNPCVCVHGNISNLYDMIANQYSTTWRNVERCARHAAMRCFDNCDWDDITRYFGQTISKDRGYLTGSQLISECARIVRERTSENKKVASQL